MTNTNTNIIKGGIADFWNQSLAKTPISRGREKVIKDYFDLYIKSGIVDFFAKKIRAEFTIPKLHLNDLQLIVIPVDEGEAIEEEKSQWYEGLPEEKRKTLDNRINAVIRELYLPKSAFEMFLHYLLYRKPLKHYPLDNTELLYSLAYGYSIDEVLGYSPNEVRDMRKFAIILLQEKREITLADVSLTETQKNKELQWIYKQMPLVAPRGEVLIKRLARTTRPLRELHHDILIIKYLKKYKKPFKEFDNEALKHIVKRMTSEMMTTKVNPDTNPDFLKREAANLRKQIERLKKKYPFLEEFILSS